MKFKEKVKDEERVDHVDEAKAHSALGLDIDGKVEVVVLTLELLVY